MDATSPAIECELMRLAAAHRACVSGVTNSQMRFKPSMIMIMVTKSSEFKSVMADTNTIRIAHLKQNYFCTYIENHVLGL
jgi:hypothetical protein